MLWCIDARRPDRGFPDPAEPPEVEVKVDNFLPSPSPSVLFKSRRFSMSRGNDNPEFFDVVYASKIEIYDASIVGK